MGLTNDSQNPVLGSGKLVTWALARTWKPCNSNMAMHHTITFSSLIFTCCSSIFFSETAFKWIQLPLIFNHMFNQLRNSLWPAFRRWNANYWLPHFMWRWSIPMSQKIVRWNPTSKSSISLNHFRNRYLKSKSSTRIPDCIKLVTGWRQTTGRRSSVHSWAYAR